MFVYFWEFSTQQQIHTSLIALIHKFLIFNLPCQGILEAIVVDRYRELYDLISVIQATLILMQWYQKLLY